MYVAKPEIKLTRKTLLLTLMGLAAFLIYIVLFKVDLLQVISIALGTNLSVFSVAVAASVGEVFFKAASWQATLNNVKVKISLARSFLYTWYGIFIDTIIPTQGLSGDFVRTYLINQEQDGTGGKVAASLVIQRILIMAFDVGTLILGIVFLAGGTQLTPLVFNLILAFTVVVALAMTLLLLVSVKENWDQKIVNSLIGVGEFLGRGEWKQKLTKTREDVLSTTKKFHDAIREFGCDPARLAVPILFLVFEQVSDLAVSYLVFLSLGLQVSWVVIFITASLVEAIQTIPTGIPFGVGLPEIAMSTLYALTGISTGVAATATILIRLLTLWLRFAIGFAAQQYVELKR